MTHKPVAGLLTPRGSTRVEFARPLTDSEQPMILTVNGSGAVVYMLGPERDHMVLTNQTDKHAPFVLLIIPQNPPLNIILEALRQRMGG